MIALKESMELAGRNLIHSLAPSHDNLPFWNLVIEREGRAACTFTWPSHNVGRWWDAMLRLEAATGFSIPADIEAAMLRNLQRCFDNPLSVCGHLIASGNDPAGWIDIHSQRESLLALACLARYRRSRWAEEQGARAIRALDRYILPDSRFDWPHMAELAYSGGIQVAVEPEGPVGPSTVTSHGRLIEALVEFHLATGDEVAIRLADRLARLHFEISTRPDGSAPVTEPGKMHTHSYFNTLRGLLLLGETTGQQHYIERAAQTYRATVRTAVKESGFISHDFGLDTKGETASPGDAAQLALWLARHGYTKYLDDAERIVRARILPSQVTQPLGLKPKADDGTDEHSDLDERAVGAFGGMHLSPHGGCLPTTDITAADLHTLCDIYTHIVEPTPAGLQVNFHLDYSDERVTVACRRDEHANLRLDLRARENLWIRVPGWTPMESVSLSVAGKPMPVQMVGCLAFVPTQRPPSTVEMRYALPVRKVVEPTDGVEYTFTWRGDDVLGVTPNTDLLPFYRTA